MKKIRAFLSMFILFLLVIGVIEGKSQAKESKGQQYVNVAFLMNKNCFYYCGGYEKIIDDKIGLKGDITWERGKIDLMAMNNVTANLGMKYTVFKFQNISYSSVGAGLFIGNEYINSKALDSKELKLSYGISVSLNSDVFVAKRISIGLSLRQYYLPNSLIGKFNYMAGLNVRYRL